MSHYYNNMTDFEKAVVKELCRVVSVLDTIGQHLEAIHETIEQSSISVDFETTEMRQEIYEAAAKISSAFLER